MLFRHPLNGFHVLGVGAVFAGVLANSNSELRCSRWIVAPALAILLLAVAIELELDAPPILGPTSTAAAAAGTPATRGTPAVLALTDPIRRVLLLHWLN